MAAEFSLHKTELVPCLDFNPGRVRAPLARRARIGLFFLQLWGSWCRRVL